MTHRVGLGLYGRNGHQLPLPLPQGVRATTLAVCDDGRDWPVPAGVRVADRLEALLAMPEIELISLCSPRRADQAEQALRCLAAGKHVLAEKPCAFDAATLRELLAAAKRHDRVLVEMAGSELEPSIQAIRRLVDRGELGDVVQVMAQKSYPWHERRPRDEAVDGGLVRQVGIHAVRFIHGATGRRILRVRGAVTHLGQPDNDGRPMAASFVVELDNGAVGTIQLNYLHPRESFGSWGNDQLRVFGSRGMAESVDHLRRHAWYGPDAEASTALPMPDDLPSPLLLEHLVNHLLDGTPMPTPSHEAEGMTFAMLALHEASVTGETVELEYPPKHAS